MKNHFKIALVAASLFTAFSVSAAQRDITVTADIDTTVDVTLADGSALPNTVAMQYLPGKGLSAHSEKIKFWSNTASKDLNVSLAGAPVLLDVTGANPIPLSVSVNGTSLSTTPVSFPYATTFPSGITNGSSVMPLVIAQETPSVVTASGNYSGIVSLVVTQAP